MRKLIAEKYSVDSRGVFDHGYYNRITSDDELLEGIRKKLHTMTLQDVEVFVESYRLNILFG